MLLGMRKAGREPYPSSYRTGMPEMACVCVHVCMHVCAYVSLYMHARTHMCMCTCVCMHACVLVRTHMCAYVCMWMCVCVFLYLHMCMCLHICTCVRAWRKKRGEPSAGPSVGCGTNPPASVVPGLSVSLVQDGQEGEF